MYAAGPTTGPDGGLVLLRVGSLEEAKAIMAADPAITSGLFTGEVRAWRPMLSDGKPLTPKP